LRVWYYVCNKKKSFRRKESCEAKFKIVQIPKYVNLNYCPYFFLRDDDTLKKSNFSRVIATRPRHLKNFDSEMLGRIRWDDEIKIRRQGCEDKLRQHVIVSIFMSLFPFFCLTLEHVIRNPTKHTIIQCGAICQTTRIILLSNFFDQLLVKTYLAQTITYLVDSTKSRNIDSTDAGGGCDVEFPTLMQLLLSSTP